MPYTQFNGWNVIPLPGTPAPRQITLSANDSVGMTQSPFTMQSQVQAWPGADWWEAEVSLPPMPRLTAAAWVAWLLALRGRANVFQFGDPLGIYPQGAYKGLFTGQNPAVNGAHLPTATVLNIKNLPASVTALMLPGDYVQIGYRLHVLVGTLSTDSNGNGSVEIWPSIRDSLADGIGVYIIATTGLWRLADNKRVWSMNEVKLYGLSFKAVEAR